MVPYMVPYYGIQFNAAHSLGAPIFITHTGSSLGENETVADRRLNYWAASTIITPSWIEKLDWDN